jgi:hypothetical protein
VPADLLKDDRPDHWLALAEVLARKAEGRRNLAKKSFGEKIAAMEELRERLAPIRRARKRRGSPRKRRLDPARIRNVS